MMTDDKPTVGKIEQLTEKHTIHIHDADYLALEKEADKLVQQGEALRTQSARLKAEVDRLDAHYKSVLFSHNNTIELWIAAEKLLQEIKKFAIIDCFDGKKCKLCGHRAHEWSKGMMLDQHDPDCPILKIEKLEDKKVEA